MSEQPGQSAQGPSDPTPLVDWEFAVKVGSRFAGEGPEISRAEADAVVAELRHDAHRSTGLVREYTRLSAATDTAPVLVVDRPGWVRANADGFATVLTPLVDKMSSKKGAPGPISQAVGSRVTGAEVGMLLGFLGSKVLGQFDPFHEPAGRLLLVAPNIVHVERELDVDTTDFRLWVCLHEETHRVQFTAVPWMRDHLRAEIMNLADSVEPARMLEDGLKRVGDVIRGEGGSLVEAMSSPEQRVVIDRITGVMSLLEGHADVVMDGVGPEVIPTVDTIRRRFTKRRKGASSLDRLVRRLLGMEAKMAQYRDGAVFVRAVVDKVGMEDFNAVWAGPENLPSKAEIEDPAAWVARVHG
ncbi:coenzyme F420 biosynthesis-associated protein [Nocardioides guangzhouensis]|uniref:Coenzyme F420 biosynthesis-associated protein n=1 Tax=Nocardioides guangzhouensis TaxID=2497878 RepID=A0A4Q4ZIJ2_9ACTN|nr:zinc-dependent metalloprotease [Nocardioides guangzhouensis]RYP88043.1 coenzyme F420 biosynthesis-associated protein [Nocardioides guangzhouensis]